MDRTVTRWILGKPPVLCFFHDIEADFTFFKAPMLVLSHPCPLWVVGLIQTECLAALPFRLHLILDDIKIDIHAEPILYEDICCAIRSL
jgi:hypothetical protein